METKTKDCLLILMADGQIEDHNKVKRATRNCNVNHVFSSVYNGAQLLDTLKGIGAYENTLEPDLLIMDIKLELVDGFEVLNRISKDARLKNIPIYILTKTKSQEDVLRAKALGVKDYFQKPLKDEELAEIVNGICRVSLHK